MKHIIHLLCCLGLVFVSMPKMQAVSSIDKDYKLKEAPRKALSKLGQHLSYLKDRPGYKELDTKLYQVKGELFASIMEQKQAYVYASRLKPFLDLQKLVKQNDQVTRMTIDKYKAQVLPPKPKLSNPRLEGWLAVHKFEETSTGDKKEERTMVFYLNPQLDVLLDASEWYGFDLETVLASFDILNQEETGNLPNELATQDSVFSFTEIPAKFIAEGNNVQSYMLKHITYPDVAVEFGIQGRLVLRFVINLDGSVSDVEVLKELEQSIDLEAIRVLLSMPAWQVAEHQGKKVRSNQILPISFRIQ